MEQISCFSRPDLAKILNGSSQDAEGAFCMDSVAWMAWKGRPSCKFVLEPTAVYEIFEPEAIQMEQATWQVEAKERVEKETTAQLLVS